MDDELFLRMAASGNPMFGRVPEPSKALDFNLSLFSNNDPAGMLGNMGLNAAGSMLSNSLFTKLGLMPGQLFGDSTNLFDQQMNKQYWTDRQAAMSAAAQADKSTYVEMLRGIARMASRGPLTPGQERSASNLGSKIAGFAPVLAEWMPEMFDAMHGRKGSATVMAQFLHRGGRYAVDPVTGMTGLSGASAGAFAKSMQEEFFGPGADLASMRGITAGQFGAMYDELQRAGQMPRSLGAMTEATQIDTMAGDQEFIRKQATKLRTEQAPLYEKLITEFDRRRPGAGIRGRPAADQDRLLGETETDARNFLEQIKKLGSSETTDALKRDFDKDRIGRGLKDLVGVTAAMKEIFGDAGRPNAPMRELVAGLNMLTQQGTVTMSPADLERSVRLTQSLAKSSGLGMAGMQQLMASGASMADALGIERAFAVSGAQGAAAFGQAFGQVGAGDRPHWQARSREEHTLLDERLRMQAAKSGLANQLATGARIAEALTEQGQEVPAALKAMVAAANRGDETFKNPLKGGAEETIFMEPGRFEQFMGQVGIDPGMLDTFRRQLGSNREFTFKLGYDTLVHRRQYRDIGLFMAQAHIPVIREVLARHGKEGDAGATLAKTAADVVAQTIHEMDPQVLRDDTKRNKAIMDVLRKSLPDMGITEKELALMAEGGWGAWNTRVQEDPALRHLVTGLGGALATNKIIQDREKRVTQESRVNAAIRSELAGMGGAGPMEAIMDMIGGVANAKDFNDFVGKTLGGRDPDTVIDAMKKVGNLSDAALADAKITDRDLLGVQAARVAKLAAAFKKESLIEPTDDAGMAAHQARLDAFRDELNAIRVGGRLAGEQIDTKLGELGLGRDDLHGLIFGTKGKLDKDERDRLAALWASEKKGFVGRADDAGIAGVGGTIGKKDIEEVLGAGERMTKARVGRQAEEALRHAGIFTRLGGRRIGSLLNDEAALSALGAGGLDLARGIRDKQLRLRELADVKDKGDVSKLLASSDAEADALVADINRDLKEVVRRQDAPKLDAKAAAEARDAAAKAGKKYEGVEAMGPEEKKRADELRKKDRRSEEEQNRDIIDRIARETGGDRLTDDERKKLAEELGTGDAGEVRRHWAERQLDDRKKLDKLAKDTGLDPVAVRKAFREGRGDELTSKLKPKQAADFKRLAEGAGSMLRVGAADEGDSSEVYNSGFDDIRKHSVDQAAAGAGAGDKKLTQRIIGTMELLDPKNVLMTAKTEAPGRGSEPVART